MMLFLECNFYCAGKSKTPTWRQFGFMHVHSLRQYLISANIWYEMTNWCKVSRACCKGWWFYKYRNFSWRSTPDFSGCWFEIPILILNNNQLQLLNGKGIKQRYLEYPSALCAHERYFVQVWKVMEANRYENSTILSQISVVVDLHEESALVDQQIITNWITLL